MHVAVNNAQPLTNDTQQTILQLRENTNNGPHVNKRAIYRHTYIIATNVRHGFGAYNKAKLNIYDTYAISELNLNYLLLNTKMTNQSCIPWPHTFVLKPISVNARNTNPGNNIFVSSYVMALYVVVAQTTRHQPSRVLQ